VAQGHGGTDPDEELSVFDYILGIPAHPLFIHFAVVLTALLVAGAAVYALVPPLRGRIWWAVGGLAVVAPFCVWFAKLSGEHLFNMLVAKNYPKEIMDQVNIHLGYGNKLFNWTIALGGATALLVLVTVVLGRPAPEGQTRRSPHLATIVLSLATLVLVGFTGYYLFKTGDAGSHAVWGSFTKK
jgi:hypothetical protein